MKGAAWAMLAVVTILFGFGLYCLATKNVVGYVFIGIALCLGDSFRTAKKGGCTVSLLDLEPIVSIGEWYYYRTNENYMYYPSGWYHLGCVETHKNRFRLEPYWGDNPVNSECNHCGKILPSPIKILTKLQRFK